MRFNFTAIGPMCDYLSQSIKAFEEFGKVGFIVDPLHRARFRLLAVHDALDSGRSVYESGELVLNLSLDISQAVSEAPESGNEIAITFRTPTRIENLNARSKDRETGLAILSDFYDLVYNTAHRVAGLWQLYGKAWPGPTEFFRWRERLLKLSRQITTIQNDLKMMRLCGYSNLQEAPKPLDGFVGSMRFSGDFSPFIELLRIAEIVHLGSETTCGLGQFRIS
jgi:CRISPR-associated endoribonuclease Cas6